MRRRTGALAGASLVLTVGVLSACQGGGGINIPTSIPTSISVTLPTVPGQPETTTTLPPQTTTTQPPRTTTTEPPRTTTTTEPPRTTTQTTTVTDTVTNTVTTTVTNTPTTTTTTPTTTTTTTNTATAAPTPQPVSSTSTLPPWAWVVLALLLIGLIALIVWLVQRSRVRGEWDDKCTAARRDAQWFEDSLVQQVMSRGSTAEAWRTWQSAQPRLLALDESLYSLATTAPDEERGARATQLRARVGGLVEAMGADTSTGPDADVDDLRDRRAAVERARTELRQVLDAEAQRWN